MIVAYIAKKILNLPSGKTMLDSLPTNIPIFPKNSNANTYTRTAV